MPRKQQKNMNGGGFFDFLGVKTAQDISPDERAKHLKDLESKTQKDLASMVVGLEDQVKKLESELNALKNPVVATNIPDTANYVRPAPPAMGGRRRRRKTRKSVN